MKFLLSLLVLLTYTLSFSQNKSEQMLGSWYMYHGNHQISNRVLLQSGFQLRTYGLIENHNLSFGYLGIGYKTQSEFLLTLKYGYLEIDRSFEFNDQPNAIEHRIMEDVSYTFKLKSHKILQRLRLEHRFIHFMSSDIEQHRFRYRIGYQYPISKKITFDVNNEFFFQTKGKSNTENRFYIGTTVKTSKVLAFKIGYLKQFINELHLNRLQIGVTLTTDFR